MWGKNKGRGNFGEWSKSLLYSENPAGNKKTKTYHTQSLCKLTEKHQSLCLFLL